MFKKIFFTIISLTIIIPSISLAIGQMVQPIIKENVLRGQEMTEILLLTNAASVDTLCNLAGEGKIADWMTFYKAEDDKLENSISEILIPAKSRLKAIVKFTAPKDVPNGKYSGQIVLSNNPDQGGQTKQNSVNLVQRIGRDVTIMVTDKEIINFKTSIIPLKYGVSNKEPLRIKAIYTNLGNVSIKPDVQLKIIKINNDQIIHNAIYLYPEGEDMVRAFSTKTINNLIEWQAIGHEVGYYKAEIKILLNGEVKEEHSFKFQIGNNISKLFASVSIIGGGNLSISLILIGIGFIIMLVILKLIKKKEINYKIIFSKIKSIF
ncbi:MAG: hypothetical protein PHS27_01650 [Candidatus Pacebacteria bacterium]|nr:hypothetical protein [Candidatus Paceibacterota bacterium]